MSDTNDITPNSMPFDTLDSEGRYNPQASIQNLDGAQKTTGLPTQLNADLVNKAKQEVNREGKYTVEIIQKFAQSLNVNHLTDFNTFRESWQQRNRVDQYVTDKLFQDFASKMTQGCHRIAALTTNSDDVSLYEQGNLHDLVQICNQYTFNRMIDNTRQMSYKIYSVFIVALDAILNQEG